jgi:hypothetical protein
MLPRISTILPESGIAEQPGNAVRVDVSEWRRDREKPGVGSCRSALYIAMSD